MAILELQSVSKRFGGLKANSDVSFRVEEGQIVGLIGPNGAGKTTLFNGITGFDPPTSGEVRFRGQVVNGLGPDALCRRGMVRTWQKVRPLAKLSVLENAMIGALCHTSHLGKARAGALAQLERVGLAGKKDLLAGALPIGERKKLEVARALATEPTLLLLDEVMGGLNPAESEEIIALLLALRAAGGLTQVVIEHDMKAIMRLSDHVVVLNSGEKLTEGPPETVVRHPAVIEAYLGESHA